MAGSYIAHVSSQYLLKALSMLSFRLESHWGSYKALTMGHGWTSLKVVHCLRLQTFFYVPSNPIETGPPFYMVIRATVVSQVVKHFEILAGPEAQPLTLCSAGPNPLSSRNQHATIVLPRLTAEDTCAILYDALWVTINL